jgi:hypothetical protein
MKKERQPSRPRIYPDFDVYSLLRPDGAFGHPRNVVIDPGLTMFEKRAILSSWASYTCAVAAAPELHLSPGDRRPPRFEDVIDALHALDEVIPRYCGFPQCPSRRFGSRSSDVRGHVADHLRSNGKRQSIN